MIFARQRKPQRFDQPSTVDPSGMVTATSATSRQIQLGAKLQFRPSSLRRRGNVHQWLRSFSPPVRDSDSVNSEGSGEFAASKSTNVFAAWGKPGA